MRLQYGFPYVFVAWLQIVVSIYGLLHNLCCITVVIICWYFTAWNVSVLGVFLVQVRENTDQKDSKYRHFLGSVYAKHTTFLYCISLWCKTYSILIKRGTIYSLLKSLDIRKFWKDVFLQQTFDNYLSWLKINSFLKEAPVISKRIHCFAMQINGLVSIW